MTYKLYDNGQIMKVISEGHEVAYTMNKQIRFVTGIVHINTQINLLINYETFNLEAGEHQTDTSVNKIADVYVNGKIETTIDIVNGEGIIPFESKEAGTFEIMVDNYKCEVVVNE